MKKIVVVFWCLIAALLASSAFAEGPAGSLTYTPESASVTVAAGSETSQPLTIGVVNTEISSFYLWFVNSVAGGNLPASWITAKPGTTFLNRLSPSSTTLTIKVPQETAPGAYSGYIYSKAMAAHGFADAGTGMLLTVIVPAACTGVPAFEITSFGPSVIWPPDQRMQTVTVSGTAVLPAGCSLLEIGYAIEDEYGILTSVGTLPITNDGSFTLALPVEASREGQDRDGRHYRITLYARDEAGAGTSSVLETIVPHDMR